MKLQDDLRQKLEKTLNQYRLDTMFGDGLEMDYLEYGITITGTEEMTDSELVQEFAEQIGADEEDFEPDKDDGNHNLYAVAKTTLDK